jgi:ATP adenylyltransferase
MDHLWSPWRLEYVSGAGQQRRESAGCVFCLPAGDSSRDPLILYRGALAYVVLNLYPYNNGHLLIVPYRHEPSLAGLTRDEMAEVGLLLQRAELALLQGYPPDGINVGVNLGRTAGAGIATHVHVHVVPRWDGDTSFMTAVSETRVIPESLDSAARRLRPIFERLARS